jgi:hypothetical protein
LPDPVFFALAVSVRELAREALESTPADLSEMEASIDTVVTALTGGAATNGHTKGKRRQPNTERTPRR